MADTTKTPFAHAPASRLVGAYLIDLVVLGALLGVTWYVHFTAWTIGMITAEAVVASALMLGASGRTPGMALMRVCLIRDEEDAQTPSLGAALGYTALAVLLQLTGVGLLASYAMVHDGRTWLNGPTRTRFVDLRKHAALAAGPGEVERLERSSQAPSGFDSVREGADQWSAPTAPLTPVPSSVPDYSAPGQRTNDPYGEDYSAPATPAVSPLPAAPAMPAAPSMPAAPVASAAPAPREPNEFDALLAPPQGAPDTHRPAPQRPAAPSMPAAPAVPPLPAAPAVPAVPAAPAQVPAPPSWGAPSQQVPPQSAQASYGAGGQYAAPASGVPGPPPSRRDVQAGQRASQWGGAGQSQWGAPATPPRTQLLWLIFDSGQRELIDMPVTLGRAPAAVEGSRAVVVPDATMSLSRTHMRVGPTASGAWIEDSFSANGTQIRTPDGRVMELTGGQAVEVPAGTEVIMGDRRATIVYADADSVH
ncbi:RDD family protein [Actinomyces sp. HMSC035G02]|uniref:RDD family protein n=1 Tax=Actinomyces sp. HMSC035G02 TaxID=1739406 RepID=UPI0008A935C8|nr:RDD family protein [Actinomyces sp. HMSC035G02]OHR23716.1 translation initiation factor 2 [Actinomyces sp. HMSC035G02]